MRTIELSEIFFVKPERIYHAWLNSVEHTKMTGSPAQAENTVGGKFSYWDGFITGHNAALDEGRRIVQKWRSRDFPREAPDSDLEILLEAVPEGTKFTLRQTNIPDHDTGDYQGLWEDFYFESMHEYFGNPDLHPTATN